MEEEDESKWTMLAQGAEAKVYLAPNVVPNKDFSVVKHRFQKTYRHPELELKLSKKRFKSEVKSMEKAYKASSSVLHVPKIEFVDSVRQRFGMEYVQGNTVKHYIEQTSPTLKDTLHVAEQIGQAVAALHDLGVVHGDLTTSNMVLSAEQEELFLIDFGLAFSTRSVEDFAVDLYVLERAFLSTHPNSEDVFHTVLSSYCTHCKVGERVHVQFLEVQQRGRKRLAFG